MAQSGVRVTVIDKDGRVLANRARTRRAWKIRPIGPKFSRRSLPDEGQSVRHSATLNRDLVYRAVRYQPTSWSPGGDSHGAASCQVDASLADLRRRLLAASLVILASGRVALFVFFRSFAARVDRLKQFSLRLATGDFRPLPAEGRTRRTGRADPGAESDRGWMDRTIRSLSGERNRSSAILRSMVEGVAVIDAQERLVFSNRAFSEILNLDSARSEGRPLIEVVRNSELLGLDSPRAARRGGAAERHRHGHRPAAKLFRHGRSGERARERFPPLCGRRRPAAARRIARRRKTVRRRGGAARRHRIAPAGARAPGFRGERLPRIQNSAHRDSGLRRNAAGRRDRRSPEQPPLPWNHSRSCHAAGALDRRLAEAGAHRSRQTRSAASAGGRDGTGGTLRGNGFAEIQPETDRPRDRRAAGPSRRCAAMPDFCATCCRT